MRICILSVLAIGALALLFVGLYYQFTKNKQSRPLGNFDPETQSLIEQSDRVVFLVPFSHWDTDWHQSFAAYSQLSDQNILAAIQLAKQYPRFRFTMEQVLFVQHFWNTHPEEHADLVALVHQHQLVFAWGGITQPETSLAAPSVQVHNLQLGQAWISQTFGPEYVPRTAWQSDAFGNSAAFPSFLSQFNIPYLFIGRYQGNCDPDYQKCQALPPEFYWTSPSSPLGIPGARTRVVCLIPSRLGRHLPAHGSERSINRTSRDHRFRVQSNQIEISAPSGGLRLFQPTGQLDDAGGSLERE